MKRKKTIIAIVAFSLLIGAFAYGQYRKANAPPEYETVFALSGDIFQSVDVTGKVKSAEEIKLRFEIPGTLSAVNFSDGDFVDIDDVIMTFRTSDLDSAVAQASANLNQRLAGATKEDIAYYQAAANMAKASLDAVRSDKNYLISNAEFAVQNALNNLKMADGGDDSIIVKNAYESALAVIKSSMSVIDNSITQSDNILGIDNAMANDEFEQYLSLLDFSKLILASDYYRVVRNKVPSLKSSVASVTIDSPKTAIDIVLSEVESMLSDCVQLLVLTRDVLNATAPVGNLTQSTLDSKKTIIETARANASSQYNSIINSRQNIVTAKNSYSSYSIAYEKSLIDLENVKKNADTNIALKEASYDQAVANLSSKVNPPREVDIAALRAVLSQALANRAKATLKAPIDGMITKIFKKRGEYVSVSEVVAEILSPHYEIEVDIPETDVVKLSLQNKAVITLDAYGDDVKFKGKVVSIEPASTVIQDVVYFKVKVAIENSEKEIMPGMTANVIIHTAEAQNVIHIPSRSLRTGSEGNRFVKILKDGQEVDMDVVIGLRADDGRIEIKSGLNEGEEVIVRIIEK